MTESVLTTQQQLASLWDLGGLSWGELARRTWGGINQNELIDRAYELAFNFLLAVFPFLLFLLPLLGLFASHSGALRKDLFFYAQQVLPPEAYRLVTSTLHGVVHNAGGGKLTFGLVFSLVAGSSGITQAMATLNAAYEVREGRSWIRVHLISLGLTVAISVMMISALLLVLAGGSLIVLLQQSTGHNTAAMVIGRVLQWGFALGFVVLAYAVIYYYAPDVKERHWYWITPGSVVGVILWAMVSVGLRVYLYYFNTYSKIYGSLGAVIILLLWFYITGLAFLVGGQINSSIEHAAAEHGHPEAKPAGRKAA